METVSFKIIILVSMALLTAKLHKNEQYEKIILQNSEGLGKDININQEDLEELSNNIKPIVPLKPVISIKNKDCNIYHLFRSW